MSARLVVAMSAIIRDAPDARQRINGTRTHGVGEAATPPDQHFQPQG
jgi:hypothetical protein